MATNQAPTSYKDPYWTELASNTETKLGLPSGLLASVVTKGERSNNDQVSEAGAKTPFQIIPSTRKAVLDKYGVDAYLSPDNAAEAAGLLLKESLARNKGDQVAAVSEYHGGTDRANWGPRTRSYVARVLGGQQAVPSVAADVPAGASTFQRALANQQASQPSGSAIASVYQAYQSGQMTPDEAKQFEGDVKAGLVMLPKGASLTGAAQPPVGTSAPQATVLPKAVTDAYVNGKMSDQERADLESDMKAGLVKLPPTSSSQIPGGPDWVAPTEQGVIQRPVEPSFGQKLTGAGEAALTTATGLTGGLVGTVVGGVNEAGKQILSGNFGSKEAADMVEKAASQGAQALTYQPRTATGQEYAGNVGEAMQQLVPLGPLGGEMAMLGAGIKAAAPAMAVTSRAAAVPVIAAGGRAAEMAKSGAMNTVQAVKNAPQRAMEMVGMREPSPAVAPTGGRASIGAAATPQDVLRASKAENLPVPMTLTKGAETRDAAQLAFEKEQMKGELGAPLRARAEENNLQALQNFDSLIDMTDAQLADVGPSATGGKVSNTLAQGYKQAKTETRVAYKNARNSPEAQAAVDPNTVVKIGEGDMEINNSLIGYLNDKVQGVPSSSVTDTARKLLVKMDLAAEDANGNLVGKPATVGKMEDFRRELSGTAKFDDKVGLRDETILKKLTDAQTEPVAGPLYKQARALRTKQAMKYENRAVVARLISNRKGMADPAVAVDQVFNKSILNASPEEITFLKRVILTSGEDGPQTWKELQGATLKHIKDEASKGMGMDSADNPIISPAKLHQTVTALDKNGRLDIVLGKKAAETVRDLNEVVRYVNTVPPGTLINNSGTVGTLLAAMGEAGATGALTGLPVPAVSILLALSKQINNNKLKLKINAALNAKPLPASKF